MRSSQSRKNVIFSNSSFHFLSLMKMKRWKLFWLESVPIKSHLFEITRCKDFFKATFAAAFETVMNSDIPVINNDMEIGNKKQNLWDLL